MLSPELFNQNALLDLRLSIDHIDTAFMNLLVERIRAVIKIGILKKKLGLSLGYSEQRDIEVKKTLSLAKDLKLNENLVKNILDHLFKEGVRLVLSFDNTEISNELDSLFFETGIESLRKGLYHMDLSMCHLLSERFRMVHRVGLYKRKRNIPPLDTNRWNELIKIKRKVAKEMGISPDFIENIFNEIHKAALELEHSV